MLVTYAKASGESFSGQWNPKQQNNWQTNRIYCVWLYVSKENSCIGLASKQLTPLLLLHYTQLNASAKKDQNNKHLSGASYSNHSDDTIRCTKHKIKIRIKNKNQKWVKKKINVVPWLVWWFCLTKNVEKCIQFFQIIGMGLIHIKLGLGGSKFERKSSCYPCSSSLEPRAAAGTSKTQRPKQVNPFAKKSVKSCIPAYVQKKQAMSSLDSE